jgi:hypothetical protein
MFEFPSFKDAEILEMYRKSCESDALRGKYSFDHYSFHDNVYKSGCDKPEWTVYCGALSRWLCCRSFTAYGERRGRLFMHDDVHFNERAGDILAGLIVDSLPNK